MPIRIGRINLTSDTAIDISDHLTIVVGPNNVGKSVLLDSVFQRLTQSPTHPRQPTAIVASVDLSLPEREALEARLGEIAAYREPGQYPQGFFEHHHYFLPSTQVILPTFLDDLYRQGEPADALGELAGHFVAPLKPDNLSGQLGQVAVPNLYVEQAVSPLQRLWADRKLEAKLQESAKTAFGIDLTVNRFGGAQVGLHVGRPTSSEPQVGELSPYLREISALPQAATQGRGIQAFLGLLLLVMTSNFDIILIDEPETYLHPPQARLLGQYLVDWSKSGTQIIAATHSIDFLQGVLSASANTAHVSIARLTRPEETRNSVAQISPATVSELFEDPLLRYSRILDGIFYKGTILCESEADCKYYNAVMDHYLATTEPKPTRPDLLFTHCWGKDRFDRAVKALNGVRVPTAVIADIDLLADRQKFEGLLSEMGGDPAVLNASLNTIDSAIKSKGSRPLRAKASEDIGKVLDAKADGELSDDEIKKIRGAVSARSGWAVMKEAGKAGMPGGEPSQALEHVMMESAKYGLFILEQGELERFHPTIGGNKQIWLRRVFEDKAYETSPDAVTLLQRVIAYIAGVQDV